MQAELPEVAIIGVNEAGLESGNEAFCEGRDLPWLQDTAEEDMWGDWAVNWRDVYILDSDGTLLEVYNLTIHDLAENYDELKGILTDYAQQ
jgi:hypothetical protein